MASHAITRPLRSSSIFSQGYDLVNCSLIERHLGSAFADVCASEKRYNLKDLWIREKETIRLCEDKNEAACSAYLKEILGTSYEYKVDNGIAGLGSLPPLYCSTIQRPDVQVLQGDQILLVIKVHSSRSYEATIEKCVMSVVEHLRVKRSYNKTTTVCTGFAFPKLPTDKEGFHQCVVSVEVTWNGVKFQYKLTSIVDIRKVRETVVDACRKACLDSYGTDEQETNYAVVLSNSELGRIFGDGAIQKHSRSSTLVYVPRQALWYKYSYGGTTIYDEIMQLIPDRNLLSYIVNFEFVRIENLKFLRYKAVPHDPLTVEEASLCLHDLLKGLAQAIQEFHQHGFVHQDIRLENVCFNEQYEPVLIDLDRSIAITRSPISYGKSCMYVSEMTPDQIDWIQVGWLAAWVLHCEGEYHERKFQELPAGIHGDQFISKLINEGI